MNNILKSNSERIEPTTNHKPNLIDFKWSSRTIWNLLISNLPWMTQPRKSIPKIISHSFDNKHINPREWAIGSFNFPSKFCSGNGNRRIKAQILQTRKSEISRISSKLHQITIVNEENWIYSKNSGNCNLFTKPPSTESNSNLKANCRRRTKIDSELIENQPQHINK